ncbi:MAG: HlyC/CorC family transporter [Bacteroidia bacterium]|nr:HlyC/CorC family transporter [Bacteroidia bacterium]
MNNNLLLILVTILMSGLFSGMEIAFLSANKLKIELDRNKGSLSAQVIAWFSRNPSRFISALLLGNNIALVIYGIAIANLLDPFILSVLPLRLSSGVFILLIETTISTLIILFTAEFLPKILFRINPNSILKVFIIPISAFYIVLYPINQIFVFISELFLRKIFRVDTMYQDYVFGYADLNSYLEYSTPEEEAHNDFMDEIHLMQNAIDFRTIKLRECMTPRTEIEGLEINDSIRNLKEAFIRTGLSKIVIYEESMDNITGYCHSFDLFKNPEKISDILKPIVIAPETMLAHRVMSQFITDHKSMAVVVDEFGGTSGIVTMEDVLEEILGEIEDEYDDEDQDLVEVQKSSSEYIFSGRLEIDYLNEKYNLQLPVSEEYETLAGLIIQIHQSIPVEGDVIRSSGFLYRILQASNNKIEKVFLTRV